nr:hypothetical protein SUGSMm_05070 [Morganella morganii subsp. sibonii]
MYNVTNSFRTEAFIVKYPPFKAHKSLILIITLVVGDIFQLLTQSPNNKNKSFKFFKLKNNKNK